MSQHYEIVFSLFLRDDTPGDVLDELRWHLGADQPAPRAPVVPGGPHLRPDPGSFLPGGDSASLRRQYRFTRGDQDWHAWGLSARVLWSDDTWAEVWWQFAQWLAPFADEDGYAGFFREETDENPTLLLVRRGEPLLGTFSEDPQPFSG
ncbi:hypothetical protein [Umezawaea beigongshangensis]|uniref:hypothetical protein n=1 Tax=Umezawaea beigongshangensis TaxID=2780383 RepID=UPI0018F12BDE|nr:hypothetical protein [Umezawaea beigongshangensis]